MKRLFVVTLCGALGCMNPEGPEAASVAGQWRFNYDTLTGTYLTATGGHAIRCAPSRLDFTIEQDGYAFAGELTDSSMLTCTTIAGGTIVLNAHFVRIVMVEGRTHGSAIVFQFEGSSESRHEGIVSGESITGTMRWEIYKRVPPPVPSGVADESWLVVDGSFTATRISR